MGLKVPVIFYSVYRHAHKMAQCVVEGAKQVQGVEVSLYQVPEIVSCEVPEKFGAKAAKAGFVNVPVAMVDQLPKGTT